MELRPDGTGTQSFATGGSPAEVDTLVVTYYRNPDRLLVRVASVSYLGGDVASLIPVPVPTDACVGADGATAAGDEQLLRFAAPHLLIQSVLVSHVAPADLNSGNPYWCQEGLAAQLQDRCGA
jgi:hypothetical protein